MGGDLVFSSDFLSVFRSWIRHYSCSAVNNRHVCICWRAHLKLILKRCTTDTVVKKRESCFMSVFTEVIWVQSLGSRVCLKSLPQTSQITLPLGWNGGLVELFPADRSALVFDRRNPGSLYSVLLYGRSDWGICGLDAIGDSGMINVSVNAHKSSVSAARTVNIST